MFERSWYGNILFYLGQQWIIYDNTAHRWRSRRLSAQVPTPITNLFRSTLDTVKSAIAQHVPRFLGTPVRDDPKAIAAAGSVDTQLQVILAEGRLDKARRGMMDWLILTGNAFIETLWDDSPETGEDVIPHEVCTSCSAIIPAEAIKDDKIPSCPLCGGKTFIESETEGIKVPRGAIRFETKSPFEVYLDAAIEELEDNPVLLLCESYTKEQVFQTWNVDVEGDMGGSNNSLLLKDSVSTVESAGPFGSITAIDRQHRVTVMRLFIKNCKEYPKGAYIAITGSGVELEKKAPYPWTRVNGKKFFPLVHFKFGTLGGRAWGHTPADDLQPKQYQLNKAESLFTLIIARMANPVWLIPTNSNPTRISGEIGIQVEYTPAGNAKPEKVAGSEAPQSLVKYITDIRTSFDELSGAFSPVRGRQVGTRTPVGTIQQLTERGFGRWATVFEQLESGYGDVARIALEVWRQNSKAPRVRAAKNAVGGWTFQQFLAADWDDGIEIQVESGSARPHTQQEKLQTYMYLGQAGIINMADQAQVIKILEDVGMTNLLPGVEEDTQAAYQENREFLEWAQKLAQEILMHPDILSEPDVVTTAMTKMPLKANPIVDNAALHFLTHRRLALSPEFKALPDQLQIPLFAHMQEHKDQLLMSALIPQMPPSGGGGGGMGKQQNIPSQQIGASQ